jgi:hypothetical protein
LVGKLEKIAATLITWPFIGTFLGLLFGALFGGRGGMLFVGLGLVVGLIGGLVRSIWLYVKYDHNSNTVIMSSTRLLINRIFIVFLYVLAIYTVVINVFFPEL